MRPIFAASVALVVGAITKTSPLLAQSPEARLDLAVGGTTSSAAK
jgi:hypothetical protein